MGIFISNTLCSRPKVTTWKGNIVLRHYAQLQRHLFNCFLQKCIISLYILIIWGLLVPDRSGLFRILVPPFPGWSTQISRHRSSDWDNIGLSCRLNRLNKHSRWDEWQDKVSFCSLIRFNCRVPARVPLLSLGLKVSRSHSGRLSEVMLTHYRRREVRNSIYRYRKMHIDYWSKFSYRFISFISIIYGNTTTKCVKFSWLNSEGEKLSWFIRHLSDGLCINLWNFPSDIWA